MTEARSRVRRTVAQPRVNLLGPPRARRNPFRAAARTIRFIFTRRLYLPRYWAFALRFVWFFKITHRHIQTDGFVFLMRGAEVYARRGYGRLRIGKWVWIGTGNAIRCHEGNLRIGDKVVLGTGTTINCYLSIDIGRECLFADGVYVCDFDHRHDDPLASIRTQGIVKAPVRIGADCWIGTKATILRGVTIGPGSVVGAHALVNRDLPPTSVAAGVPARVLKVRGATPQRA